MNPFDDPVELSRIAREAIEYVEQRMTSEQLGEAWAGLVYEPEYFPAWRNKPAYEYNGRA